MIASDKSRGDSTWTMDDSSEEPIRGIAAMPDFEPLQEAHTKA